LWEELLAGFATEGDRAMARWTIEEPTKIDFDGVVALKGNIVAGTVSVLPCDDKPSLLVEEVSGHPLEVVHEAGMLSINQKRGGVEGVLQWLQNTRGQTAITLTVPRECPVTLNLVTANAVVTGMSGRVSIKTGSGDVILDGVTGTIDANTATGAIEAQGLSGTVTFNSVSGDLSLVHGRLKRLTAHSVSGRITTDVDLGDGAGVQVRTVSGEVTMRLPESISATVGLNSVGGRIDSAFDALKRQERTVARSVAGTLGDGDASLKVDSVSGSITLLSRPDPEALKPEGERDR
jgi:Putative adhesin